MAKDKPNHSKNVHRSGSSAGGRDTYRTRPADEVRPVPHGNRAERRAADKEQRRKN